MKEAPEGRWARYGTTNSGPNAALALLLTGENIPTLIGLSATHPLT
jgi:hypothetical protein